MRKASGLSDCKFYNRSERGRRRKDCSGNSRLAVHVPVVLSVLLRHPERRGVAVRGVHDRQCHRWPAVKSAERPVDSPDVSPAILPRAVAGSPWVGQSWRVVFYQTPARLPGLGITPTQKGATQLRAIRLKDGRA